jgi:nucleoid-associated protein YgaU
MGDSASRSLSGSSLRGWEHEREGTGQADPRPADPFRSRAASDELRRDRTGLSSTAPPAPGPASADATQGALRLGEVVAPSSVSRVPRSSADPIPLRTTDNAKRYSRDDMLKAGDGSTAPPPSGLEKRYPELRPSPAPRGAAEDQSRTTGVPSGPGSKTYLVRSGDNIYDIARRELGKASRWRELYDLNKDRLGTQSLDLTPGTQLLLPDADPGAMSQRQGFGSRR